MAREKTLTMFKPDAVRKSCYGDMLQSLLDEGFKVRAMRMTRLSRAQAEAFYEVHRERPFFGELVEFMTSGPIVAVALEREDAVNHLRAVMGPTNSTEAPGNTIRGRFGTDIQMNAIHGSDSRENAFREISFFFPEVDLVATGGAATEPGGDGEPASPQPSIKGRPPRLSER